MPKGKKKYLLIELEVAHGEVTTFCKSVHAVGSRVNAQKFAERRARTFYNEDDEPGERPTSWEGWYDFGFVLVKATSVQAIPQEHYDVLNQYL